VVKGESAGRSGAIVRRFEAVRAKRGLGPQGGGRLARGSGVYVVILREGDRSRALRVAVVR
jgi:hypothetical protein